MQPCQQRDDTKANSSQRHLLIKKSPYKYRKKPEQSWFHCEETVRLAKHTGDATGIQLDCITNISKMLLDNIVSSRNLLEHEKLQKKKKKKPLIFTWILICSP